MGQDQFAEAKGRPQFNRQSPPGSLRFFLPFSRPIRKPRVVASPRSAGRSRRIEREAKDELREFGMNIQCSG